MSRHRKPWYRSKTVWVNVLFVAGAILATPGIIDPKWAVLGQAVVNVLLRSYGGQPLSARKQSPLERPLE